MIAFRRAHPALRNRDHFQYRDYRGSGYPDISWHGTRAWQPDWDGRVLAFLLCGQHAKGGAAPDDMIYVALNTYWDPRSGRGCPGKSWHVSTNTGMPSPRDIHPPGEEPRLLDQGTCLVGGRSVVVLVGR
jgi:glycogen operon protein